MIEGSSFDRDIKPCDLRTVHSRNFVNACNDGSKIKITRPRIENLPYIDLLQDCNTFGAQPSMMGSIYHILRIYK